MRFKPSSIRLAVIALASLPFSTSYPLQAQTSPESVIAFAAQPALPEAPEPAYPPPQSSSSPSPTTPPPSTSEGKQTKRILGILPNFRAVSADTYLPPQNASEKFVGFAEDSFDYSSFILAGILAGVSQMQDSTPEFHSGWPAFGRYYWHSFADQTDENFWVEFALPVALHQDARYYTLGSRSAGGNHGEGKHNGVAKRTAYAISRVLVTRTDSGGSAFNFSEVVGAGASAGLSNLYYPASDRGWNKTGQRWALNVGIDGISFVAKEFWPDLNHALFHIKQ